MSGLRPLVWGGDWNHAMSGAEYAGSVVGRSRILEAVDRLGLVAATAGLPHPIAGLLSIDHVAVSSALEIVNAHRIDAAVGGQRLSDHGGYVVDLRMETVD